MDSTPEKTPVSVEKRKNLLDTFTAAGVMLKNIACQTATKTTTFLLEGADLGASAGGVTGLVLGVGSAIASAAMVSQGDWTPVLHNLIGVGVVGFVVPTVTGAAAGGAMGAVAGVWEGISRGSAEVRDLWNSAPSGVPFAMVSQASPEERPSLPGGSPSLTSRFITLKPPGR